MVASPKTLIAGYVGRNHPALWLEYRLAFRKRQFEPEFWMVPRFCRRDAIAIDVGANVGEYSYYMMKFAGRVVAFEPNADLLPRLRRVLGPDVRVECVALSEGPGSAALRYADANSGVATIEPRNDLAMVKERAFLKEQRVGTRSLDSYGFADVSLIKIDVEGHEEAVIDGAMETLARSRPVLLIESEDRHNPGAPRRLESKLTAQGYLGFFMRQGKLWPIVHLTDDERNPANLSFTGKPYVNNYLFVPRSQRERIRDILAVS